ncbi:MAG: hypothetical protein K1X82_10850 [Bacteroidia bacterium]|nr:hypothetical protein [Bacteroidia bacterium]
MVMAQPVPAIDENIPFLVTFGKKSSLSYGDDDYIQIFFLRIPVTYKNPIYVRIFDPEVGGANDEVYGSTDTKTKFSVIGGNGSFSNPDAKHIHPKGSYASGNLLATKTFGNSTQYDNDWFTFDPIYPTDGEWVESENAYIVKIIAEGVEGDDGNLYRYFFSTSAEKNIPIEGANAFTYEYTFRMPEKAGQVCHLYPYIDKSVVSVQQHNYDWDEGGVIKIVSYEKKGEWVEMSNDQEWKSSKHVIFESERDRSLDVQFVPSTAGKANNNICFYITNQYGQFLPFYTIPIGGKPIYKYTNTLEKLRETERFNKEKIYKRVK